MSSPHKIAVNKDMRSMIDQLNRLNVITDANDKPINETKKALVKKIEEHKYSLLEDLRKTEDFLAQAESIQFEKGDIVYHKDHGACIVQSIIFSGGGVTVKIAHSDGTDTCYITDLVPKTEMSEAVYSR